MPGEPVQVTMTQIAERLKTWKRNNNSVVLFLGSRAGGLFRSPDFHNTMLPFSNRNLNNLSPAERFAEFAEVLTGSSMKMNLSRVLLSLVHCVEDKSGT